MVLVPWGNDHHWFSESKEKHQAKKMAGKLTPEPARTETTPDVRSSGGPAYCLLYNMKRGGYWVVESHISLEKAKGYMRSHSADDTDEWMIFEYMMTSKPPELSQKRMLLVADLQRLAKRATRLVHPARPAIDPPKSPPVPKRPPGLKSAAKVFCLLYHLKGGGYWVVGVDTKMSTLREHVETRSADSADEWTIYEIDGTCSFVHLVKRQRLLKSKDIRALERTGRVCYPTKSDPPDDTKPPKFHDTKPPKPDDAKPPKCVRGTRGPSPPSESKRKVRVLFLHGWASNAEATNRVTKRLQHKLRDLVDFVIPNGPLRLPSIPGGRENAHGWFVCNDSNPADTTGFLSESVTFYRWKACCQYLDDICEKKGPFDGIMGFSQGAAACYLYLNHQIRKATPHPFKFAVLAGGFPFRRADIPIGEGHIPLPSFHISGTQDIRVPPRHQDLLCKCFAEAGRKLFIHSGGHIVPQKADQIAAIESFISQQTNPGLTLGDLLNIQRVPRSDKTKNSNCLDANDESKCRPSSRSWTDRCNLFCSLS